MMVRREKKTELAHSPMYKSPEALQQLQVTSM
jgi:hypothetical protein